MLRLITLSTALILASTTYSQYRTEVDQNGERISERTDINGNKQGDFIFYDYQDQSIRIDNYIDDKLTKRDCFVPGIGFEDHSESAISMLVGDQNEIDKIHLISAQSHGEVHIKADGSYHIYFYNKLEDIQSATSILSEIVNQRSYSTYTILTF